MADGKSVDIDSYLTTTVFLDKPIGQQLDEAKLLAVELVRSIRSGVIDSKQTYYERIRLIQFRPTTEARGEFARRIIRSILDSRNINDYPEIRIRVEEDEGHQRSVSVDRAKHDALTTAFQLRTLISDLDPPLEEATKTVTSHFVSAMVRAIKGR